VQGIYFIKDGFYTVFWGSETMSIEHISKSGLLFGARD
jgi:hypothetical protein